MKKPKFGKIMYLVIGKQSDPDPRVSDSKALFHLSLGLSFKDTSLTKVTKTPASAWPALCPWREKHIENIHIVVSVVVLTRESGRPFGRGRLGRAEKPRQAGDHRAGLESGLEQALLDRGRTGLGRTEDERCTYQPFGWVCHTCHRCTTPGICVLHPPWAC